MTPEENRQREPLKPCVADSAGADYGERRSLPWFETLWQDLRFGVRVLRKSPGFAFVALLTMALGIGATTAIFTVVDRVLLQPMAYPEPDRIVFMMQNFPQGNSPIVSIPKYELFIQQTKVLEDFCVHDVGGLRVNLTGGDRPEQLRAMHVSANFFSLVGIPMTSGRPFTAEEDVPNGPRLAVISHGLWQDRFGSDRNILGRTFDLDNDPYTVIGVMAPTTSPDFADVDVYLPIQLDPNSANQGNYLMAGARLKPGVTLATANADLKVATEEFRRKFPDMMVGGQTFGVDTVRDVMVAGVRTSLLVLLGAVGFVLLIACANVANLLLARATLRKREISIRAALGASRTRIARQLLTESVLLAVVGGALGMYVGYFGVRALLALNTGDMSSPGNIPRIGAHGAGIAIDWRVLLFTLVISILAGVFSGLIPAIKASRGDLATTLNESGSRSGTGLRQNKTRSVLVVIEMALAMILLVGAALLIRTFLDLRTVNPGFETHNILTMDMSLASVRFNKTAAVAQLVREGRRRLENLPGVESAAASCCLPLEGGYGLPFNIEGRPPTNGPYTGGGGWRSISPDYFSVFRIPLLRGRAFTELDAAGLPPVVIINQAMARQFWPKGDELGARITIGKGMGPQFDELPREVVGVVGDTRDGGLNNKPFAEMFVPIAQVTDGTTLLGNGILPMTWLIRTHVAPYSLNTEIQSELRSASGGLPVGNVRLMDQVVQQSTARDNFNMKLLSIFAAVALLMAAIGIYGVMAYSVQQRTQEVGIRMALGASPRDVRRMVVLQGMLVTLIGLIVGTGGGLALTRLMRSLLFEVKPWDPLVFVSTAVLLAVVALLACYVPAVRASRVDPLIALRYE
jgi:putative ABC transport system permease protein